MASAFSSLAVRVLVLLLLCVLCGCVCALLCLCARAALLAFAITRAEQKLHQLVEMICAING